VDDYTGTLNAAQHGVLQWIAAGCPAGTFEGYAHRVSAAALRSRGLIGTRGRGPTWQAMLTDAGQEYLRRRRRPDLDAQNTARAARSPAVAIASDPR
jgi:hypothetical protein